MARKLRDVERERNGKQAFLAPARYQQYLSPSRVRSNYSPNSHISSRY
jgi:hypothetical protein